MRKYFNSSLLALVSFGVLAAGCAPPSGSFSRSTTRLGSRSDESSGSSSSTFSGELSKDAKEKKVGDVVLKYEDLKEGTGAEAKKGDTVDVEYTGWLTNGTEFDSSRKHGEPLTLTLGKTSVIKGWHEGIVGMKVGGKRKLFIPPELAYGPDGRPPVIPGNATLIFEIELLKIK